MPLQTAGLPLLMGVLISLILGSAQDLRCFLFTMRGHQMQPHYEWRDTAFIACASQPQLIQEVLTELQKPLQDRRMISGPIAYGHGGHNHNGPHWFRWHFKPDEWILAEIAIELCDGRPYTDLDLNTSYWIEQVQRFCPWASAPLREISVSGALARDSSTFLLFPNPASDHLTLSLPYELEELHLTFYNARGELIQQVTLNKPSQKVDISLLPAGLYIVKAISKHHCIVEKVLLVR